MLIKAKWSTAAGGSHQRSKERYFVNRELKCFKTQSAFSIYVIVNMGMVLGLLPIVGAPLPIMSYGGSSMLSIMLGLGIAMSFRIHKDTPVS